MESFTTFWNGLMSISMLVLMAGCLKLAYALFVNDSFGHKVRAFIGKHILTIGFFISFAAVVSSLIYSNVIGYPPCLLCWWTRILFYPQILLFGLALIKKDRGVLPYTMLLTSVGLAISTYHYITESIQYSPLPCSAGGVSCLTRYVYEFGFITIPFMGLIGFLTLLLALLVARKASKTSASEAYPQ